MDPSCSGAQRDFEHELYLRQPIHPCDFGSRRPGAIRVALVGDSHAAALLAALEPQLDALNWQAIAATNWRDPMVSERKHSEFLIETSIPWQLIERIGVIDQGMATVVSAALEGAAQRPEVVVMRNWYY